MKATLFAVVLSLFFAVFPVEAAVKGNDSNRSLPATQATPKINLNKADVQTLAKSMKGIGMKRAEAIVHYRETQGAFKSIEDLAQVRGLGKQFVKNHLSKMREVFVTE